MKKVILILLLFASATIVTNAQLRIGMRNLDTTIVGNDTILSPKGAALIKPIVVNIQGDSAWSISWRVDNIQRDSTQDSNATIFLFSKSGNSLGQDYLIMPSDIINKWVGNNYIDDYIFSVKTRFKRR